MASPTDNATAAESVALLLLALFVLASPFTLWWLRLTPAWYLPYLLWLGLIGLIAWLARRAARHDL